MLGGRTVRTSARAMAVLLFAATLSVVSPVVAQAALPATQPDEVGMVDGPVRAIAVTGNKVWVGGSFARMQDANGTTVRNVSNLAVFDSDSGAPLPSVAVPLVTKTSGEGIVYDLSLGPDGLLYIAGVFDRVAGFARKNVAAIDPRDGSVAPFAPNTSAARSVLATSGAIYVGTSKLLSFERSGSPSPGYDPPEVDTDPSLRGHNTPPQVRDLVLVDGDLVAACQCDSTIQDGSRRASKAAIKVDAVTGEVQNWTPGNLSNASAAFGISLILEDDPGTGKPTVYLGAGGSDFVAGYDLVTGQQVVKTDTSGSAQVVAWMDGMLYVGGHFQWVAKQLGQQCEANDHPNTDCHHAPRLVVIDPDNGQPIPQNDPWNPGICCIYAGIWAITPDLGRGRLHIGGEFTKAGGTWTGSGTDWRLVGARTQTYFARFSGTPTTLEPLSISFAGAGGGRVVSDPPGADCTTDCEVGFSDGTAVTLSADPDPGSVFEGWSGACTGTGTCTVTMDRARAVTATFAADGPTPTCGRIAYASSRSGNVDIFTMTSKGLKKTRLTRHAAVDRDPAWSPDCSRIAYSSARSGEADIYVMDADGTNRQRLTRATGADTQPAWSPDGTRIAFTSKRTGDAEIFVMDADGSAERNLTEHAARDRAPAWSPDGGRIAFDSDRGDDTNVWTMSPTGSGLRKLTGDNGRSISPDYSPDGDTIAFMSDRDGSKQIWLMDADGGRARQLTTDEGAHSQPTWSPTGKRVAFGGTRTGRSQIWLIRRNGSALKNLSKSEHADIGPSWS
jgi:Tol biopolymer transport system component